MHKLGMIVNIMYPPGCSVAVCSGTVWERKSLVLSGQHSLPWCALPKSRLHLLTIRCEWSEPSGHSEHCIHLALPCSLKKPVNNTSTNTNMLMRSI